MTTDLQAHEQPGGRRWLAALPPALALLAGVVFLVAEVVYHDGTLGFPLDDSWIHLQFARNLAAGEGLSYNVGEIVAATTAPLWTAILAFAFLLPGSPLLWTKILGTLLHAAGVDATRRLGLELGLDPPLAVLAAVLTALTGWLTWSAVSGMEIPLFIVLSVWGIVLHLRERCSDAPPVGLALLALAVLARPEGLLLLALAFADRLVVAGRESDGVLTLERPALGPIAAGLGLSAVVLLPMAVFNFAHGGSLLPTTYAAKSTGIERLVPDVRALYQTLAVFMSEKPILTFTAVAGCLVLWERLGGERDRGLLPGAWLIGLPVAYSTLGGVHGGNFGRYYFPIFPLVAVLGILGLDAAFRTSGRLVRAGRWRLRTGPVLALVLLWPALTGTYGGLGRLLQSVRNVDDSDVAMARWIEARISPQAVLAVNDVGALKFLLPNRIVDLAGLIDPEVVRYMEEARMAGRNYQEGTMRFLAESRPDYMVIFPQWFPGLARDEERFQRLHTIRIPHNITMGGDELAIFATPWTRYPLAAVEGPGEAE